MTSSPLSMVSMMSLQTFKSAVSVLWFGLYADCSVSQRLLSCRQSCSCAATTLSMTLEINGRFEIGRQFPKILGSNVGFLIDGKTTALFKTVGTVEFSKDRLMMSVMIGSRAGRVSFNRNAGIGSSLQVLMGQDLIILWICWTVTSLNCCKETSRLRGLSTIGCLFAISSSELLIVCILLAK